MLKKIVKIIFISMFLGAVAFLSRSGQDMMDLFRPVKVNADFDVAELPEIKYYQKIGLPQLLKFRQNKLNTVIDVREKRRYNYGHIPGAVNIPLAVMEDLPSETVEKLKKSPNIVLYCLSESCDLSESAAVILYRKGLRNLNVYSSGWSEWKNCRLPIEGSVK